MEISVDDALEKIVDTVGQDYVLGSMKLGDICHYVGIKDFIGFFSEDEIASYLSESAIEEEYLKRSPLGKALE